jgi:hypothetical protein
MGIACTIARNWRFSKRMQCFGEASTASVSDPDLDSHGFEYFWGPDPRHSEKLDLDPDQAKILELWCRLKWGDQGPSTLNIEGLQTVVADLHHFEYLVDAGPDPA